MRRLVIVALLLSCQRPVFYRCPLPPPTPRPLPSLPAGYRQRACADRSQFVVVRDGERPLTADEILAFHRRHSHEWLGDGVPEIDAIGLGGCCGDNGAPNEACLWMRVRVDTRGFGDLFARLEQKLTADGLSDRGLTLGVTLLGGRAPRCDTRDPMCGPEPFAFWSGRCVVPSSVPKQRRVVWPGSEDRYGAGGPPNTCGGDGDCTAVGNGCWSWQIGPTMSTLEDIPILKDAMCGCVEKRCRWFR